MQKILGLPLLAMTLALPAAATPITGAAAIGGLDTYNSTSVIFQNPATVFAATGSLAVMLGFPVVTMDNITAFSSEDGNPLFDWNHGGTDITLTVLTLSVMQNTPTFLNVLGTAMLTETGFDPTLYNYSFTSTKTGLTDFVLVAAPVPEPSSLLLLGGGLLYLAAMLRKKANR